jgi:hypothetical protein
MNTVIYIVYMMVAHSSNIMLLQYLYNLYISLMQGLHVVSYIRRVYTMLLLYFFCGRISYLFYFLHHVYAFCIPAMDEIDVIDTDILLTSISCSFPSL